MTFVVTTGGSGGHIFPALRVAEELRRRGHSVSFVGVFGRFRQMLADAGFLCRELDVRGWQSKSLKSLRQSSCSMLKSLSVVGGMLSELQPDCVAGFGGYGSFPLVLRASWQGIPTLIHEQNVEPGRANRWLGKVVTRVAISFEETQQAFKPEKIVVTGCPCRVDSRNYDRGQSRRRLALKDKRTILIMGGSQGSRALNALMMQALPLLRRSFSLQVIHLTGMDDFAAIQKFYQQEKIDHWVSAFAGNMGELYAASDMAVTRAGAVTVAELAMFGLPALLIPYPYAGAHQKANARAFCKAHHGVTLSENEASPESIAGTLSAFYQDTATGGLRSNGSLSLYVPDAACRIVDALETMKPLQLRYPKNGGEKQ